MANVFGRKATIAGILAPAKKMMADLSSFIDASIKEAAEKRHEAERLSDEADALRTEAARGQKILVNMEKVFDPAT